MARSMWTMEREKRLILFSFPSHRPPLASLFGDSLLSLHVTKRAQSKKSGLCGEVADGRSSSFIHTYSIAIQQQ